MKLKCLLYYLVSIMGTINNKYKVKLKQELFLKHYLFVIFLQSVQQDYYSTTGREMYTVETITL